MAIRKEGAAVRTYHFRILDGIRLIEEGREDGDIRTRDCPMARTIGLMNRRAFGERLPATAAEPGRLNEADNASQGYEVGIDTSVKHSGKASGFSKSTSADSTNKALVIRQSVMADQFHGQWVRRPRWLKAEKVTVWAGLWLRIDGVQGVRLSIDNMQNRPVKVTSDWRQYELVLEVPNAAIAVSFGLVLAGEGQIWMGDLRLERASLEAATTKRYGKSTARPKDDEYNRRRELFAMRLAEELKDEPLQPVHLDFEGPIL